MKNNKKLVILSSSLGGLTLAAGALAVSCNNETKTTKEDLELEKSLSSIVVKNGLSLQHVTSLTTNDFEVKSTSDKNNTFIYEITSVKVNESTFKVSVEAKITARYNSELAPVILTQEFEGNQIVPEMFLKEKNKLRESLQKATIETVYVGQNTKSDVYLPSLSSSELKKLFELNGNPKDKTTNKEIEGVESSIVKVEAKNDIAEISVLLRSLAQPDVFATITVTQSGFKNEVTYNEELAAKKAEIVAAENARLQKLAETSLKVTTADGFKKSLTLATDAQIENFVVLLMDENANATATITKVTGDNVASKVTVEVTLTSNIEGAEPYVVTRDVLGFKELSEEALQVSNTLQELVSKVKLVHAELNDKNGSAEKAEKLLNADKANYEAVIKVNKDVLPEGVTFEVVSARTTTQHPETLLVTYSISKDGVSITKEVLVSGYNFVASKDEASDNTTSTVDVNAEIQKELDKIAAEADAQFEADAVYANKDLASLKDKKWYLASQYSTEFNAEQALKDFDLAKSILKLTFKKDNTEITPEVGKFVVKSVVMNPGADTNESGSVTLKVTIESTDPTVDKTKTVPSKSFNLTINGFMGKSQVDELKQALSSVVNNASVKDALNNGLKFEINGINRVPSTPVSLFEGSQASEYYKYFEPINGFTTTGLTGKNSDLTVQEVLNKIKEVEYFKTYPVQAENIKLEEITTNVHITDKNNGTVNAEGVVSIKIPGVDRINADKPKINIVSGFLSDAKFEELKANWYATAQAFISANAQSEDAIVIYDRDGQYFSDEKSKATLLEAIQHPENIVFQAMNDGAFLPKEKVFADNTRQAIENKLNGNALDTQENVNNRHTALNPADQIYAVKLKVLNVEESKTDTGSVWINYTLVSPYFSDWSLETISLRQNFQISGFISIEDYRKQVLEELKKLIDDQADKGKSIVQVDYAGKATTSVDEAIKKSGNTYANLTKVSYKFIDGLDINSLVQPTSILYNIDLSKFELTPTALESNDANAITVNGRDGKVDVTAELSTNIGSEYGIKQDSKVTLNKVTVEGFLATKAAEKARLNALKAQFAYKGIVSVLLQESDNRDAKIKEFETNGDFDSANALRKLSQIDIKDVTLNATDFVAIANYGTLERLENAKVVINTTLSEKSNGNIKFNFNFVSLLQSDVKSDDKSYTFGTFARSTSDTSTPSDELSEDAKALKALYEQAISSLTPSYKLVGKDNETNEKYISKVTPKDVLNYIKPNDTLEETKAKELFTLPELSEELKEKATLSFEYKEFEDKVNQNANDKIVVTVKITDITNEKIVVSKDVVLSGFLTELAKEQKALEEAVKSLSSATWNLHLKDATKVLPSVLLNAKMIDGVSLLDSVNEVKNSNKTLEEKINHLKQYFTIDSLDDQKAKISSFIKSVTADDKNGALKVKLDLSSAKVGFESVTVEKEFTVSGFQTAAKYKEAYDAEVVRLNKYAADHKFSFKYDSSDVQATGNDLVGIKSDKNPYWEKFVLVNGKDKEVLATELETEKIKLVVEAVEFGVKSTDVYVTYRLVSINTDESFAEFDSVYTGAQSSLIKTTVLTTNLITPEEKDSASGLRKVQTEEYLTTTSTEWNDSNKSVEVKSYNKVFTKVSSDQFVESLYSNKEKYELNDGKLVLFANTEEVKNKSVVLASQVNALKLVNSSDYLKFGGLELVTKDARVLSADDNKGVLEVAFRVSSIEFPEVVSPILYAKVSGFKTKAVELEEKKQAEAAKIQNWTLASLIAKTGNIITKDIIGQDGQKQLITYDEILSGNADSKLQFYLPGNGASTSDENGAWAKANNGKAFEINALGKEDYTKESLELKVNELFVAKDNVHFEQYNLSNNQYINVVIKDRVDANGDILVTYAVQLLSYNEETKEVTQLAEVENRSLLTQLPTEAELAYKKEMLSALANAEASFASTKASEMTAEDFLKAYEKATTEEAKAELLQSTLLYTKQANGKVEAADLKVVVDSVKLDEKHVGRVLVTYHVASAKTTGEYSKDEYKNVGENVKTKYSSVLGFSYNKDHASVGTIENTNPIVAPTTTTSTN
ncbi:lipoprotein 17-related variable surface protein [Mycoplasma anserisalpingitidis]|nr:lipoprotein 17-related variable surface protein [Mycoplasma anserisalpingitidis]